MGIHLQLILTICIVNFVWTFAQLDNQVADQVGLTTRVKVQENCEVQKNFQNLFSSIAKNDARKSETFREILRQKNEEEHQAFDAMNVALWQRANRNIYRKMHFYRKMNNETTGVNKREAHETANSVVDQMKENFEKLNFSWPQREYVYKLHLNMSEKIAEQRSKIAEQRSKIAEQRSKIEEQRSKIKEQHPYVIREIRNMCLRIFRARVLHFEKISLNVPFIRKCPLLRKAFEDVLPQLNKSKEHESHKMLGKLDLPESQRPKQFKTGLFTRAEKWTILYYWAIELLSDEDIPKLIILDKNLYDFVVQIRATNEKFKSFGYVWDKSDYGNIMNGAWNIVSDLVKKAEDKPLCEFLYEEAMEPILSKSFKTRFGERSCFAAVVNSTELFNKYLTL